MSHVVSVGLQVGDLDALRKAVAQFPQLEFMEGQTTHAWYGRWVNDFNGPNAAHRNGIQTKDYGKCLHAIRIKPQCWQEVGFNPTTRTPVPYEIGVVKSPSGNGYELVYDNWCGGFGLETVIGNSAAKIKQEYALQVHAKTARQQGHRVVGRQVQANGHVQLLVETR